MTKLTADEWRNAHEVLAKAHRDLVGDVKRLEARWERLKDFVRIDLTWEYPNDQVIRKMTELEREAKDGAE